MPSFGSTRCRMDASLAVRAHVLLIALAMAALLPVCLPAQSTHAAELYQQARVRETDLRRQLDALPPSSTKAADLVTRMRTLTRTYEDLWRLFPTSGYSDNALWQGAMLAADTFWQSGDLADRARSLRLFQALTANFPTSSLLKQVPAQVARLEAATPSEAARQSGGRPSPGLASEPDKARPATTASSGISRPGTFTSSTQPAAATPTPAVTPAPRSVASATSANTTLTAIRREVLPDVLRVTLELEREPVFNSERIDGPPRVFIDMQNTRAAEALKDASLPFPDDVVRQIRVGRQLNGRTRVVLDLSGAGKYSVYALYDPFRIVVDFERKATTLAATPPAFAPPSSPVVEAPKPSPAPSSPEGVTRTRDAKGPKLNEPGATWPAPPSSSASATPTAPARPTPAANPPAETSSPQAPAATAAPAPPSTNSTGAFSLSRQLGLGISRIVIDAGHGGHDPGAKIKGLTEADLTLDVALRLEKLLAKQPGVDVVLTRRGDTYVPLEERTEIANRAGADLFLSIHANASEAVSARGIETYFLNFAPNPEAEAVAARENAGSARTMRNLPDIVKAIALNNKIDESRDFASMVQASMYDKLRSSNKDLRNLGVKQAPFMVLIGATMPSILAEISFITNRQEGSLLKTEKYRQQIAEALYQGIMRYQQSLKRVPALALDTSGR